MSSSALAPRLAGIACPHCDRRLDHARIEPGALICPYCRQTFEARRFDPVPMDARVGRLTDFGKEGMSPCASHGGNAAETACSRCGVFICALCRIEVGRLVLCPPCFERMKAGGDLPETVASYRDYGRMSLILGVVGLVPFLGLVAGPGGLYYAWRARTERLPVPHSAAVAWSGLVLGAFSTLAGIAAVVAVVRLV